MDNQFPCPSKPEPEYYTAICSIETMGIQTCGWTADWPTEKQAQQDAVWHIYLEHPEAWVAVIGNRPPQDPNPREEPRL